jgi:hypothetical protein
MNLPTILVDAGLTRVVVDNITLWFSYQTLVAFRVGDELVARQNVWGATTGKHLNQIDGRKQDGRVDVATFCQKWMELTGNRPLLG